MTDSSTPTVDSAQPLPETVTAHISLDPHQLEIHPIAEILPMMQASELAGLTESIELNGQKEPVALFEGKVLDGRNRVEACRQLNRLVEFKEFKGTHAEAVEFVTETNLERREMSPSQKACAAVDLIPYLKDGVHNAMRKRMSESALARWSAENNDTGVIYRTRAVNYSARVTTAALAAAIIGAGTRNVEYALQLKNEAPNAFALVKAGAKSIKAAIRELHGKTDSDSVRYQRLHRRVARMLNDVEDALVADHLNKALERLAELKEEAAAEPARIQIDPNPDVTITH